MLPTTVSAKTREGYCAEIQAEYLPLEGQDGMFLLSTKGTEVAGATYALEDVTGLRSSLQAARGERDTAQALAKTFDGVDLAEHKRLTTKKAEIDAWDPSNDDATTQRLEEQNASWQTKYDTDLGAATVKAEDSDERYKTYLKKAYATEAIGKIDSKLIAVLLPHVLQRLEVYSTADSNVDAVWVRGDNGKAQITSKAGSTGNMSAGELLEKMKDDPDFIGVFPGTGATGSGATGSSKGTGTGGGLSTDGMSPTQKLAAARREKPV